MASLPSRTTNSHLPVVPNSICRRVSETAPVTRERAEKAVTRPLFLSIGGLALLNAAVAVFWR